MLPQITEIILVKKPLVYVEMKVRKQHLPGVCSERGAADPADTVLLATSQKTVKVKVAPIECDQEQVVQRGDAAVVVHLQAPPNSRVDLEKQDVELVNLAEAFGWTIVRQSPYRRPFSAPDFSLFPIPIPSLNTRLPLKIARLPSIIIFSAKGRTAFAFAKVASIRFYSMRLQTWFASSKFRCSAFRPNLIVFFA
jgi:hypothetical protein